MKRPLKYIVGRHFLVQSGMDKLMRYGRRVEVREARSKVTHALVTFRKETVFVEVPATFLDFAVKLGIEAVIVVAVFVGEGRSRSRSRALMSVCSWGSAARRARTLLFLTATNVAGVARCFPGRFRGSTALAAGGGTAHDRNRDERRRGLIPRMGVQKRLVLFANTPSLQEISEHPRTDLDVRFSHLLV